MQGLGLLINLVEYSARNKECLVEMEVDMSYLMETEAVVKIENDVKTEEQKEDKMEEEEKRKMMLKSLNALAALVQVTSRSLHL